MQRSVEMNAEVKLCVLVLLEGLTRSAAMAIR